MASHDVTAGTVGEESSRANGRRSNRLPFQIFGGIGLTTFDLVAIVGLTLFAGVLRVANLDHVPPGLHGDEAWTGIDARRILDEGWIGVYVGSALGQPTGPLYFTAFLFTFLPETTFTIRLSMALFGVATIPLAYGAFAVMFNRRVGIFGALILASMMWHLHLSRTGFMVTAWPFFEVAMLLTLWLAFNRRSAWLFVASGALLGLGVYTYNAYLLFVPVAFVPVIWTVLEHRGKARVEALYMALLFSLTALLLALPMLRFINNNRDFYEEHQRVVGVVHKDAWKQASFAERVDIIWDRGREFHHGLVYGGRPDLGDGLAGPGFPPVEPIIYGLALIGLVSALWNLRRKEFAVCVAAIALLPWGSLLTVEAGMYRRTLGLAPFIAVLAAIPLAILWDAAARRRDVLGVAVMALVLLGPAYAGARAIHDYFGPVQDSQETRFVFLPELAAAARWMDDLPGGTYVYFYSERWSIDYETVRFLAQDVQGENRSREFRPQGASPQDEPVRTDRDHEGSVAFVLLGGYVNEIERIEQDNPGGSAVESTHEGEVLFRAYVVES